MLRLCPSVCLQNNTGLGLSNGSEELPYGCPDVHNAAGELWVITHTQTHTPAVPGAASVTEQLAASQIERYRFSPRGLSFHSLHGREKNQRSWNSHSSVLAQKPALWSRDKDSLLYLDWRSVISKNQKGANQILESPKLQYSLWNDRSVTCAARWWDSDEQKEEHGNKTMGKEKRKRLKYCT